MKAYWKSNGEFPDGKKTRRLYIKKDEIWHDAWLVDEDLIHYPFFLKDIIHNHGYSSISKFCLFIFNSKKQCQIFEV